MFWNKNKSKSESEPKLEVINDSHEHECFARTYAVELLFENPINEIPTQKFYENLCRRIEDAELVSESANMLLFSFKNHLVEYSDAKIPSQIAIFFSEDDVSIADEKYAAALHQSWQFENAKVAVSKCMHSIVVTDFLSSGLEYCTRMKLFQNFLYTLVELLDCKAIFWMNSEQIIDPIQYIHNNPDSKEYNVLYGPLNVRLFIVEGTSGDMVMDTIGLGAIGLPDLQCHFKTIDVNIIANILYNYGTYIFDMGDVIADGNTIAGISENDKWICNHELSLMEPRRVVLDINTGESNAAGKRS